MNFTSLYFTKTSIFEWSNISASRDGYICSLHSATPYGWGKLCAGKNCYSFWIGLWCNTKVELPIGSKITMVCPDCSQKEWLGFTGSIDDNPFYDICRSQFDIKIDGNWKKLLSDHRGFHWMMAYGNYTQEMEYACPKIGIEWQNVSEVWFMII